MPGGQAQLALQVVSRSGLTARSQARGLQGTPQHPKREPPGDGAGVEKSGLSTRRRLPAQMPLIDLSHMDWGTVLLGCGWQAGSWLQASSPHKSAVLINYCDAHSVKGKHLS